MFSIFFLTAIESFKFKKYSKLELQIIFFGVEARAVQEF